MHDAHLAAAAAIALPDLAVELAGLQPLLPRCGDFRLNRLEGCGANLDVDLIYPKHPFQQYSAS